MKKIFVIIALAVLMLFTSCEPSVGVPNQPVAEDEAPILSYARMGTPNTSKGLNISVEDLSVDHFEYKFTYLGHKSYDGLAVGETDGWTYIKQTPNDWKFYLEQGLWRFEAKAVYIDETSHTFDYYEGYVNKKENALSLYIDILLSSYDEHGTGSIIFDDLMLPALYADKTNFYVGYELLDNSSNVVKSGTVPMAEVKSGDGVATMEDFRVDNISAGDYSISILVYEMNEKTGQYEVKSGVVADGIKVYSGCNSTVTGTFGDDGNYLNATIRTFQTATTFTGKVDSSKLNVGGNNTYDNFTFTCTADSPRNIRWFVDGIEQTEITKTVSIENTTTHYYWKCPSCGYEHDTTSKPKTGSKGTTCDEYVGFLTWCNGRCQSYTQKEVPNGTYHNETITEPSDGTETELTVQLSQMGHGNSGATTHYVECIYVDVEGHVSSSTQEMFVGSKYFPNLGASSIFVMGNGNEIDHWKINLTPDSSLSTNGFSTYSSAEGDITIDADKGIWISEGLWVVNSATAYDSQGMALIETTNPMKTYINKMNPYINIENVVKAETTETGTIKISDLKMNSLDWTCNYATGHINPLRVDTDITIHKLDEDGNDDSSFSPVSFHIDGCTLLETGRTVSGTEGGRSYSYHNDTYQIIGANTERSAEVPEGTYRVQIEIDSGTRDQYITTYGNNYKANYAGNTKGHLEVIVNVQAHTTQTVTGTLSCNHCIKTDGTI